MRVFREEPPEPFTILRNLRENPLEPSRIHPHFSGVCDGAERLLSKGRRPAIPKEAQMSARVVHGGCIATPGLAVRANRKARSGGAEPIEGVAGVAGYFAGA